jgi:flagellar motility protein MotE (MotC chaperone)
MTVLRNPLVTAVAALVLAIAAGFYTFWREAGPLLVQALAEQARIAAAAPRPEIDKGWDFWTVQIESLANELKDGKAQLKKESEILDQREARIAAQERELAAMRSELEAMRKDLSDRIVGIRADEAKNLRSLAQTYSNLTPRAAVAIFREMDDATAVKILFLMKPDIVGPIFEEMSKTAGTDGTLARRAAILSEKLRVMKAAATSAT